MLVAGIIQFLLGYFKAGFIAYFVPSSVIKGMLTGIGLLIILKQIPYALGYQTDYEGSESFIEASGGNTFTSLMDAWNLLTPGALLITAISLAILILWDALLTKNINFFKFYKGPLWWSWLAFCSTFYFKRVC